MKFRNLQTHLTAVRKEKERQKGSKQKINELCGIREEIESGAEETPNDKIKEEDDSEDELGKQRKKPAALQQKTPDDEVTAVRKTKIIRPLL